MFGTKHLILLCLCVILAVVIYIFTHKWSLKSWLKLILVVGIISEVTKIAYYILANEEVYGGYLPKTDLPFQLCSIQIIFVVMLNVLKNEKFKRILLSFMLPSCLIGGLAAILIPTSSSLTGTWVITTQYFVYHTMIISFSIYLFGCKEIEWNIKDYVKALCFLGVMGFIAIYINSMFYDVHNYIVYEDGTKVIEMVSRTNFMYVVDPPQSGLPFLNKDHGWGVYIMHYAFTAVFAITLCYIVPIVKAIKNKFMKA